MSEMDKKAGRAWAELKKAQRIVIKVGTSTLTYATGSLNLMRMESLVRQMADLRHQGREVIFVTSGAIGAGMDRLNIRERPPEIARRQALAAVGQGILMQNYEKLFGEYGLAVAQVLLTGDDLADRRRYLNARSTLWQILAYGAVPIINENDTVAFEEIKVGDNDTLAAMVAGLTDADLLVLLSDINGLYTADPRKEPGAQLITAVEEITPAVEALAGGAGSRLGTGGMKTKIAAARIAITQGIPMALVNGSRKNCLQFLNGTSLEEAEAGPAPETETRAGTDDGVSAGAWGTLFMARSHPLGSRKGWLAFSTRCAGSLQVDRGAAQAILQRGKSLLPSGITGLSGEFGRGQVLEITWEGRVIARGITNYDSADLQLILGKKSQEIDRLLGPGHDQEVIHRDNLSLWD